MNPNLGRAFAPHWPQDQPALIEVDVDGRARSWSRAELEFRADAFARALAASGACPGDRVVLLATNAADHVTALLGGLRAGAVIVPVGPRQPDARIAAMLDDAGPVFAVTDDANAGRTGALPAATFATLLTADPGGRAPTFDPGQDDLALLMYTSGSTGEPKGVPIRHAGYLAGLTAYDYDRARAAGTRAIVAAPLNHMNGQAAVLVNLWLGATTVLLHRFDAAAFGRAIDAHRVDEITGVPTMLARLFAEVDRGLAFDGSSVSMISIGSAPLSAALAARIAAVFPRAHLANGYGTTETGIVAFGAHPAGLPTPPLALGYPMPGVEARLSQGDRGALHLKTPMMARGYWRRPDLTAARFVNGFYDTGDVMARDEHGFFQFTERADDMFVTSGHNLHPAEVERILEAHTNVAAAAVVPMDDMLRGAVPVAFIVARAGTVPDLDELRDHVRANAAQHAVPRYLAVVQTLPSGGTEKTDRAALIAEARARFG